VEPNHVAGCRMIKSGNAIKHLRKIDGGNADDLKP
jgi:hypothetical protein